MLVILPRHASYTMVRNDCQKCVTTLMMQNPHCDEAALRCIKVEHGCHRRTYIELFSLCSIWCIFIWKLWNQSSIFVKTCYRGVKGEGNPLACWLSSSRIINDFCLWYLFLLAARAAKEAIKTWRLAQASNIQGP